MSIGFTGTQKGLTPFQKQKLLSILMRLRRFESLFRHGDCVGADAEANEIANRLDYKIILHPPLVRRKRAFCEAKNLKTLPEKDYLDRNNDIANFCNLLIACPKEFKEQLRSGTWSTVRRARKVCKKMIIIFPDGSIQKENI